MPLSAVPIVCDPIAHGPIVRGSIVCSTIAGGAHRSPLLRVHGYPVFPCYTGSMGTTRAPVDQSRLLLAKKQDIVDLILFATAPIHHVISAC